MTEFERGVLLMLERIAFALEASAQVQDSPTMAACAHPDDARIQFGGMQGEDEFFCRQCGQMVAPVGATT